MNIERTMEFILEHQAKAEMRMAAWEERQAAADRRQARNDRQIAGLQKIVKIGLKLMVKLEQGQKRNEAAIKDLAAAQTDTQKTLKAFIESMRRGSNGRH